MSQQQIVTQARTWIGTRFHHQGRVKTCGKDKGGCDCIGLVVGVIRELGLVSTKGGLLADSDKTDYSMQPSGLRLLEAIGEHLLPIAMMDLRPGDLLVFHFGGNPQHVGIVGDYLHGGLSIIHTYASAKRVVEHHLSESWLRRAVKAYRFSPEHFRAV